MEKARGGAGETAGGSHADGARTRLSGKSIFQRKEPAANRETAASSTPAEGPKKAPGKPQNLSRYFHRASQHAYHSGILLGPGKEIFL